MPPLVSVVIPALNARPWIEETLQSVIGQTHPKASLEVVVIDDGSTDATAKLAADVLARSGLRHVVLRNDSSAGPSAARNRGWRSSNGGWIQFLDADDLLEPTKIERQARQAATATAETAALFSPWGHLTSSGGGDWNCGGIVAPKVSVDPLREVLHGANFIATGSLLFARSWIERVEGYNESYRLVEDIDLLMRLIMSGATLCEAPSERPLFWYRGHAASLSRENHGAFVHACLRNLRAAEAYWRETLGLTRIRAEFLAESYFFLARFFAEHDPAQFESLLDAIYTLNPDFVPIRPLALKRASQIVGYRRAEQLAIRYRRVKRLFRPLPVTR
jgi:glycosyltransferase involved in cell wall biosynthesis